MRQCELLGLCRSSYYYQPVLDGPLNLELMRIIDEQYTKTPFYGVPRMTHVLRNMGYPIGHKRIERLMHLMGIQAIYPKQTGCRSAEIPISAQSIGHKSTRSGVGHRYHLYTDLCWFCISGSHYRLVFSVRNFLAALKQHRQSVLHRGA